jgi:hypothetical protein
MKWLREPLVQFLLIGAALFGIFALWGGPSTAPVGQYHIVITPGMVQNLIVSFQNQNVAKRAPTDMELDALIDTYVRDEVLNREARALGLDQDDTNVRSWLSKRMEFYLEGNAIVAPPTEDQLAAFLQKNAVSLRKPDGTLPPLKDNAVRAAWEVDQQRQAALAAYEKLRARYTVEVQKAPPSTPAVIPAPAAASGTTAQK